MVTSTTILLSSWQCRGLISPATNKRTYCQLLTICHHWQTVGPTELISLLVSPFTVFPFCPANNLPTQTQTKLKHFFCLLLPLPFTEGRAWRFTKRISQHLSLRHQMKLLPLIDGHLAPPPTSSVISTLDEWQLLFCQQQHKNAHR